VGKVTTTIQFDADAAAVNNSTAAYNDRPLEEDPSSVAQDEQSSEPHCAKAPKRKKTHTFLRKITLKRNKTYSVAPK